MPKRALSYEFLRILTFAALVLAARPASASDYGPDLFDTAVSTGRFSTFIELIETSDLEELLRESEALTIFAPSNAAFRKIDSSDLAALKRDPERLHEVLRYHLVHGAVSAAEAVRARKLTSEEGRSLDVAKVANTILVNGAKISRTDIPAANGYIHEIDSILVPRDPESFTEQSPAEQLPPSTSPSRTVR